MGRAWLVLWLSSTMMCPVGVYRVVAGGGYVGWAGLGGAGVQRQTVRVAGCCSRTHGHWRPPVLAARAREAE